MFRKPRHEASTDIHGPLTPSVGRPPSPPCTSSPLQATNTHAKSQAQSSPLTPVPNGKTNGQKAQSPAVQNGKPKPRANWSILKFFKKADSNAAEALFVGDAPAGAQDLMCSTQTGSDQEYLPLGSRRLSDSDDVTRFHETAEPIKRRKTSHPGGSSDSCPNFDLSKSAHAPIHGPTELDSSGDDTNGHGIDEDAAGKEHSARTPSGPFVDESDSDDDRMPTQELHQPEVDPAKSPSPAFIPPSTLGQGLPNVVGAESIGYDRDAHLEPPARLEDSTKPEQDCYDEFEGLGEFEDEFEEGEEFQERRWQLEQEQLEAEAGFEDEIAEQEPIDIKRECTPDGQFGLSPKPQNESTVVSSCPICNASLAGVSDEDSSIHVNNCLDGRPTPLPITHVKLREEETTSAHSIRPSSKFRRPERPAKPPQESPFTLDTGKTGSSAFSKLMSGHSEENAWATAAAAERAAQGRPAYQRSCPFYKILPGFSLCVDAFRYGAVQGCNGYFLSHFHSDHYVGLTASWSNGPIYCSRVTANLVRQQLKVDPKWVKDLDFEEKLEVPNTGGVHVTMIPANHCPGSSLYLFEKEIGKGNSSKIQRVLHCGDFRACPAHVEHPLLKPEVMDTVSGQTAQQKIDVCYLDTTYLNPKYAFPSQEDVITACADMCLSLNKTNVDENDSFERMKRERAGGNMAKFVRTDSKGEDDPQEGSNAALASTKGKNRGRLLVVVGTYSIGKERICLGIARALNSKIYAPQGKQRICAALEDREINARLTKDPRDAQVHMTPLFEIRAETLVDYMTQYSDRFGRAVGFRPSGWNYRPPGTRFTDSPAISAVLYSDNWKSGYSMRDLIPQRGSNKKTSCFGVPYSEHSSFRELTMFCCALNIDKVIPTVNVGSAKSREKMRMWCDRWALERKKNGLFKVRNENDDTGQNWYPGRGTWELKTTL